MLDCIYDIDYWKTYVQSSNFSLDQIPDLTSKVAIVTGANVGLGFETALELARNGAHVFLACRNKTKALLAIEKIERELAETAPHLYPKLDFLFLDLADLRSVARSANAFLAKGLRLDILVNNAGIGLIPPTLSKDGVELVFAINHLGSMGHDLALPQGGIQFGTLSLADEEPPIVNYNRSKLANILYVKALARRLTAAGHDRVYVNAVHPGFCMTDIDVNVGNAVGYVAAQVMLKTRELLGRPAADGALTQLYCATSPQIEEKNLSGRYFVPDGHELRPGPFAMDTDLQERLYKYSEDFMVKRGLLSNHEDVYGGKTHHSKLSHEAIAGAASYEAMKEYQKNQESGHHKLTKEAFAGLAGAEADKLFETKGLSHLDRERVRRQTEENAGRIHDQIYGM
ncbi:hypothetical protein BGZ79_009291 [Entomortierella chlamydospora]|nr:hypothetical protein BGZ79_009291 [Entomortierella chlamydospora]